MMWRWILATIFLFSFSMGTSFTAHAFTVSVTGFWPSVVAAFLIFIYLWVTALYYLEATLASPPGANIFSMTRRSTGPVLAWLSSVILLLNFFSLLATYFFIITPLINGFLSDFAISIPSWVVVLLIIAFLGGTIFAGLHFTLIVNLVITLIVGFIFYQIFREGLVPTATIPHKKHGWEFFILLVPTLVNAHTFHFLIPTLAPFLDYSRKKLQSCIIVGLGGVTLFFIAWEFLLATSSGKFAWESLSKIQPEAFTYDTLLKIPLLGRWLPALICMNVFAVTLILCKILIDFFSDMFHIPFEQRTRMKQLPIWALIFLPILLSSFLPLKHIFGPLLFFMDVGNLYLTGILPLIWVWSFRYFYRQDYPRLVPGEKKTLILMTLVSCIIFYLFGLETIYRFSF